MVTVAGVRLLRAHVPPLFASVIVTTVPVAAPVAEQLEKAPLNVTVGVAGTVNAASNVTVMVLAVVSAPTAEGVKPTTQEAVVPGVCGVPATVTPVGVVAVIVTVDAAAGEAGGTSFEVATLNAAAAYVPTVGFVTPTMTRLAVVLAASAQVPPLFARVIVTTLLAPVAVAEQFTNIPPRLIVGVPGTVKLEWNVAVMVPPAASDPPRPTVNATV